MPTLAHLLNLLALSSLTLLAVLAPVTEALSLDTPHIHVARHHDVALKKRDSSSQRRCKHRSNPSVTHVHNTTSVQDSKSAPSPSTGNTNTPSSSTGHTNTSSSTSHSTNTANSNNSGSLQLPKIGIAYDSGDYTPLKLFKT